MPAQPWLIWPYLRAEPVICLHNPFYDNDSFFSIDGTQTTDAVEEASEAEMEKRSAMLIQQN